MKFSNNFLIYLLFVVLITVLRITFGDQIWIFLIFGFAHFFFLPFALGWNPFKNKRQ